MYVFGANPPADKSSQIHLLLTHCQICFSHVLILRFTSQEKCREQLDKCSKYAKLLRLCVLWSEGV